MTADYGDTNGEEPFDVDDLIIVMCALQEKVSLRDRLINATTLYGLQDEIKKGDEVIHQKYGLGEEHGVGQ